MSLLRQRPVKDKRRHRETGEGENYNDIGHDFPRLMVNTFESLKIEVENNSVSEAGSRTSPFAEAEVPLPLHPLFRGPLMMHNDMEFQ